jgi:hypothetical protein
MREKTWGVIDLVTLVEVEKVHPQLARAGESSQVS